MTKPTIEYISKLERAIKQKYGEEALIIPKENWDEQKEKEYIQEIKKIEQKSITSEEEKEKVEMDGFYIDKRLIKDSKRVCSRCKRYSFKSLDDVYFLKFECCYRCYIIHYEGREYKYRETKDKP